MSFLQQRWLSGCLLLLYVALHVGGTALHALPGCDHDHFGSVCRPQAAAKATGKAACSCRFHQRAAERTAPADGCQASQDEAAPNHVCPLCQHLALSHWQAPEVVLGDDSSPLSLVVALVPGCHAQLPFGVKLPRGPPAV